MNPTIDLLMAHRSDRRFTDAPVDETVLQNIVQAARHAPSSINAQAVTLIVVRDAAKRLRCAELAGGQPWIAQAPVFVVFVLDYHRTDIALRDLGIRQTIPQYMEGLIAGTTDIGIHLATLMIAARSAGLGVVPIGGIRRSPLELAELLGLPEKCFPVVGLAIGHVSSPAPRKPRLPLSLYRHDECYRTDGLSLEIAAYDRSLVEHWNLIGRPDGASWSANTAGFYDHNYRPRLAPALKHQGFSVEATLASTET